MGGTLADRGGHNILEPAVHGKPVIVGPYMQNFREIAADFEQRAALVRIESGDELAEALLLAVSDPDLGRRSRDAAEVTAGGAASLAADRVSGAIYTFHLSQRAPVSATLRDSFGCCPSFPGKGASGPRLLGRKCARAQKLPVPVISVGNITTGGTGKTPLTIELLRMFRTSKPGMLTRGHGRTSHGNVLFMRPNETHLTAEITGDEAQLCMRGAGVPIGIGSDRFTVGKELLLQQISTCSSSTMASSTCNSAAYSRPFPDRFATSVWRAGHLVLLGRLREPLRRPRPRPCVRDHLSQ